MKKYILYQKDRHEHSWRHLGKEEKVQFCKEQKIKILGIGLFVCCVEGCNKYTWSM